jgi:hypothetical protein
MTSHPHAIIAIIAACMRHQIGDYAARRMVINQSGDIRLYYLALTLQDNNSNLPCFLRYQAH